MSAFNTDRKVYKNPATTTVASTTIALYTITSGRKFRPTSIIIANPNAITNVSIIDNATTKIVVTAPANNNVILNDMDLKGTYFEQGIVNALCATGGTVSISIAGYEE